MKYDLSSPGAIAAAAVEADKERLRLHEVGFQTGKYQWQETNWLSAYGQALKDCAKQLEPMQRLFDSILGYLGEHFDSNELYRMFHEDMGMTDDEIEFLGFDFGEPDELDGEIEAISNVEYVRDYGNGYKIQKVFANELPDGCYGDIFHLREQVEQHHPGAKKRKKHGLRIVSNCMNRKGFLHGIGVRLRIMRSGLDSILKLSGGVEPRMVIWEYCRCGRPGLRMVMRPMCIRKRLFPAR